MIEIDGNSHAFAEVAEKDNKKSKAFKNMGLTVLRFTEKEVIFQRQQVIQAILTYIEQVSNGKDGR